MLKSLTLLSLAATLTLANAQAPDSVPQAAPDQPQPSAPIIRGYPQNGAPPPRYRRQQVQTVESQPIPGVWLRSEATGSLTTVSATPQRTEVRLDRGRLNVTVHQPAQHAEILIDLPGGQTSPFQVSLLKDGLYTFNADTNTVRVLHGEAAFLGANETTRPIKIKEDHQLSLASPASALKSVESYPYELTADLLPPDNHGEPGFPRYALTYPYAYPLYAGAWGYPYGYYPGFYGYPYSYGVGFGYYRGFGYRGGFGGPYRGGFRR